MRIDYARGCFSDNELESAYVRREWRRTTSTFAVTIVILIAALTETYTTYTASSASTEEPDTTSP